MKKLLFLFCSLSSFLFSQDATLEKFYLTPIHSETNQEVTNHFLSVFDDKEDSLFLCCLEYANLELDSIVWESTTNYHRVSTKYFNEGKKYTRKTCYWVDSKNNIVTSEIEYEGEVKLDKPICELYYRKINGVSMMTLQVYN